MIYIIMSFVLMIRHPLPVLLLENNYHARDSSWREHNNATYIRFSSRHISFPYPSETKTWIWQSMLSFFLVVVVVVMKQDNFDYTSLILILICWIRGFFFLSIILRFLNINFVLFIQLSSTCFTYIFNLLRKTSTQHFQIIWRILTFMLQFGSPVVNLSKLEVTSHNELDISKKLNLQFYICLFIFGGVGCRRRRCLHTYAEERRHLEWEKNVWFPLWGLFDETLLLMK